MRPAPSKAGRHAARRHHRRALGEVPLAPTRRVAAVPAPDGTASGVAAVADPTEEAELDAGPEVRLGRLAIHEDVVEAAVRHCHARMQQRLRNVGIHQKSGILRTASAK